MEIIIKKTSQGSSSEEKPCKEAIKIIVPYWNIRTCNEKYFNEHFANSEGL